MRKNLARGRLIFACVWLGIFAVSYILWAFFLSSITGKLVEYESLHPENEAKKVFTEYFVNADPNCFSSYDEKAESRYDVKGSSAKYFCDLTYGKELSFSPLGEEADGKRTFAVLADGEEFARFVLKKEESDRYSFGVWTLDGIKLTARPAYELRITAPKSAVVTVNGVLLEDSYAVSEYMLDDAPYFGGDTAARVMVEYKISGLYREPSVSASLSGAGVQLGLDREHASGFSAERAYISYLSYLHYGK